LLVIERLNLNLISCTPKDNATRTEHSHGSKHSLATQPETSLPHNHLIIR